MDSEIKALYDLAAEVLMAMVDDRKYTTPANRREHMALEQVSDASQSLYAACINLGVLNDNE